MTNLNDKQKALVKIWAEQSSSLSEIQKNLAEQFGLTFSYMETRFLVADLGLTIKDKDDDDELDSSVSDKATNENSNNDGKLVDENNNPIISDDSEEDDTASGASVSLDQINKPGAAISGKVTFAGGQEAEWLVDTIGRLSLQPSDKNFQPSAQDMQDFQTKLRELMERGIF